MIALFFRLLKRLIKTNPHRALVWRLIDYKVASDCFCNCGAMGRWLEEKEGNSSK